MSPSSRPSEADWEQMAKEVLGDLFWNATTGPEIAPGSGERESWNELLLRGRLRAAMIQLNPDVARQYVDQAITEITTPQSQDDRAENYRVHRFLTEGYRGITYVDQDGQEQTPTLRLVGSQPHENDWLVANQVTIVSGDHERRFDVVLYLNGLPVVVVELKNAGTLHADVASAHAQLQTYVREFPLAFRFAVFVVATDGISTRYGTPFTSLNHFAPWNVDDDGRPVRLGDTRTDELGSTPLDVPFHGLFNQDRFLKILQHYVAFDEGDAGLLKRIAKPHQYFAVTRALAATVQAVGSNGKAGVVWHTQGSGKSMEMELYANRVVRHPALRNPTIVVITDRTELDGQLFQAFERSTLLPERPQQVLRRADLRAELTGRVSGGIYFTTLQKFGLSPDEKRAGTVHPLLSDRSNIVIVVDEAHRSHYDDLDGYARHLADALPRATRIAFTGTPISETERDTQDVFGDYIDIYDLTRAVEDGATVPVYFEGRLIKVQTPEDVTDDVLDAAADAATAGLDDVERDRIERGVAVLNAVYGAPARLATLAADVVAHWETRRAAMSAPLGTPETPAVPGKAMIVCATREICARLYTAIVELRPDWHTDALESGRIKVVYSGDATDKPPVSDHVRRDSANEVVKKRLKDPDDELEIVLVQNMMLTGFDAPPLHTLYLDRPLKGALLMQTLARVNRTFRGKEDGLLVAYAPIEGNLQRALAEYTATDRAAKPVGKTTEEAADLVEQLLDQLRAMLGAEGWQPTDDTVHRASLKKITRTVNWLRSPGTPGNQVEDGEKDLGTRFREATSSLSRYWALAGGSDRLADRRDEIAFYEEVRVWMAKFDAEERQADGRPIPEDVQVALNRLLAETVVSGEVLDIYQAAGIPRPSLQDLTPDYAHQAQQAQNPHLAIEALRKLVQEEGAKVSRHNLLRQRAFSDRLTDLIQKYTNQQLSSAQIIAELIAMAKEVSAEASRGQRFSPPLDEDQLAFYDAVASNESAVEVQGEGVLAQIARELVAIVQRDAKTDWTVREDVRAKLRSSIKRLLVKYDYPPDKQKDAVRLVIEQMEAMAPRLAAA
ncbi:type I restriction endonuclease subunit R [Kineococcus sp. TBRC 1896]|uniref:Type I restriction enzyme endonuclease subunit n=1 Tax=Kineococcus mangrovi TaxID=1660183 RepID=A0ABV4HZB3_9ACTN